MTSKRSGRSGQSVAGHVRARVERRVGRVAQMARDLEQARHGHDDRPVAHPVADLRHAARDAACSDAMKPGSATAGRRRRVGRSDRRAGLGACASAASGGRAAWPPRARPASAGRCRAGRPRALAAGRPPAESPAEPPAETPAPGASVRDTSAFNPPGGSTGGWPAGLSAAAVGGVGGAVPAVPPGGFWESSGIQTVVNYAHSRAPFCHA